MLRWLPQLYVVIWISYFHKINEFTDFTASFLIAKALKGVTKAAAAPQTSDPISRNLLNRLVSQRKSPGKQEYDKALHAAMFLIAFYALCRVSEVTADRLTEHTIQRRDVVKTTRPDVQALPAPTDHSDQQAVSCLSLPGAGA